MRLILIPHCVASTVIQMTCQYNQFHNNLTISTSVCHELFVFLFFLQKEGGYIGFYRGLMPTVVGMAPYAGKLKILLPALYMCLTVVFAKFVFASVKLKG